MSLSTTPALPPFLDERIVEFAGTDGADMVRSMLRPADTLMTIEQLRCFKASRLSFADLLCRRMVEKRRTHEECDDEGAARLVYLIEAEGHAFTYIARAYPWDGIEKIGRRSDGASRDMFGALFVRVAGPERIAAEFETFDAKTEGLAMRTDADVIGWTPANRSSRHFDAVVDALVRGEQPTGQSLSYMMRNGGFQSSGRNGSISFLGIPSDHPLSHPFFADLFAVYLVRLTSIDLANAVARRRNPDAAQLEPTVARQIGIGNSSGQGMCVALQRWPHWVAGWVSVRETALAFAKSRPVDDDGRRILAAGIRRAIRVYERADPQLEDYVADNGRMIADLSTIDAMAREPDLLIWNDLAVQVAASMDGESVEQLNSLLLDLVPEFCDAVAPYLRLGAAHRRTLQPAMTIAQLRDILRRNYGWALRMDRTLASTHQHFWYHSADNGEQRRGERIIDQHEHFESFIDHVGLIQRLATVVMSRSDDERVGDLVLEHPDLHFAISRVQYLDEVPYAEIRGALADRDFRPSDLIRFFLASLGIRGAVPLSIRYVRGTFYQDHPLPAEFADEVPAAAEERRIAEVVS